MGSPYRHLESGQRQNNKKEIFYYWPISGIFYGETYLKKSDLIEYCWCRLYLYLCVAHMINPYQHLEGDQRQNNKTEKYYYWPISGIFYGFSWNVCWSRRWGTIFEKVWFNWILLIRSDWFLKDTLFSDHMTWNEIWWEFMLNDTFLPCLLTPQQEVAYWHLNFFFLGL